MAKDNIVPIFSMVKVQATQLIKLRRKEKEATYYNMHLAFF